MASHAILADLLCWFWIPLPPKVSKKYSLYMQRPQNVRVTFPQKTMLEAGGMPVAAEFGDSR
jgi:hypothetical protein